MRKRHMISALCIVMAKIAMAQSELTDSIKTKVLNEVVVEATMQRIDAKQSIYPTRKQKNASKPLLTHLVVIYRTQNTDII